MNLVKKGSVIFAWVVGAVFTAILLAYIILFVINLKDQPPSVPAAKITQLYQTRNIVIDENNAYVFILGISSPPDMSPMQVGRERNEWIRLLLADPSIDTDSDPLAVDHDYRVKRDEYVAGLSIACSIFDISCVTALETSHNTILNWLASEQWLFDRYKSLIAFSEYFEPTPYDVRAPLPSYSIVLDGQKLLFLQSWILAEQGDVAQVRTLLDQDLIFWRMVLGNSDSLISKMIATAAISRHFKMANLVIRNTPKSLTHEAVPPSWRNPIDAYERSMQRCYVGEWIFADNSVKNNIKNDLNLLPPDYESGDYSLWSSMLWILMEPLWQPQESLNIHADMLLKLSKHFDIAYDRVDEALEEVGNIDNKLSQSFPRAYNLTGDLLFVQEYMNFAQYAVRVTDLEGLRRIAVLSVDLRASGINANAVAVNLEQATSKNPYNNDPFEWDNEQSAVVFTGLEPGDRGKHSLVY